MTGGMKVGVSVRWGGSGFSDDCFHGAAILWRQALEVQSDAVFYHPPLRAVLVLCDCFEAGSCGGPHGEQQARIVSYAVRFSFLAETFRRASSRLRGSLHLNDYVISQIH
jgi:hypothetical protein